MRNYGLTFEDMARMVESQGGGCAICGDSMRTWFVKYGERTSRASAPNIDHCHTTGVIRGVLCTRCNRGLGLFQDRPNVLRDAAAYLERKR